MGTIASLIPTSLSFDDQSLEEAWKRIANELPALVTRAADKVRTECCIPAAKLLGVLAALAAEFRRPPSSPRDRDLAQAACGVLQQAIGELIKRIPGAASLTHDNMAGVVMLEAATALVGACPPSPEDAKALTALAIDSDIVPKRRPASRAFANAQDRALKALFDQDAVDAGDATLAPKLQRCMERALKVAMTVTKEEEQEEQPRRTSSVLTERREPGAENRGAPVTAQGVVPKEQRTQRQRSSTAGRRRRPYFPSYSQSHNTLKGSSTVQLELLGGLAHLLSDQGENTETLSPTLYHTLASLDGVQALLRLLACSVTTQRKELKAALRALGAFAYSNKLDFQDLTEAHARRLLALVKVDSDLLMAVADFISNTAMNRRHVQELYRATDGLLPSLVAATAQTHGGGQASIKVLRAIVGVLYKCDESESLSRTDAVTVVQNVAKACIKSPGLHARLARLVAQLLSCVEKESFKGVFEQAAALCFSPCAKSVLEMEPTWQADVLAKGDHAIPPLWPLLRYRNGTPRLIFEAAHRKQQAKTTIYEAFPVLIGAYWAGTSATGDSPALPFDVHKNTERLFVFDLLCSAGLKPGLASSLLDASYEIWLERQMPLEKLHSLVVQCLTPFPSLADLASRLSEVLLTPLAHAVARALQRSCRHEDARADGEAGAAAETSEGATDAASNDMAAVVASVLTAPLADTSGADEDESNVDYWRRPLHDALHELLRSARAQRGTWTLSDAVTPARAVVMPRPQNREPSQSEAEAYDACLERLAEEADLAGRRLWFHGCTFGRAVQYTGEEDGPSRERGFEAFKNMLGPDPLKAQDLGRDRALYLSDTVSDAMVHNWVNVDRSDGAAADEDAQLRAVLVFAVPDTYLDGLDNGLALVTKSGFHSAVASSRVLDIATATDTKLLQQLRETLLAAATEGGPFSGCNVERLRRAASGVQLPIALKKAMTEFSSVIEDAPWALTWLASAKKLKKNKDTRWAMRECVRPQCTQSHAAVAAAAGGARPAANSVAEALGLLQQSGEWACPHGHAQCRRRVQLAVRTVEAVDTWKDMWQNYAVGVIVLESPEEPGA